ncbi:MAG: hypothetical protein KAH01_07790 [Caldisericia bacterium]|nr:hypothetical protein [Caldisericia bacterium]
MFHNKQLEWGSTSTCPFLDKYGYLYRLWCDLPDGEKIFLTKTNLLNLEDKLSVSLKDIESFDIVDVSNETIVVSSSSTTLSAYDNKELTEMWKLHNATGYSEIQQDGTMLVILKNKFICHIRVDDGMIIKYWCTKIILNRGCKCTNLSSDDQTLPTTIWITPNNVAIVFIDEAIPFALLNTVIHT